jgi:hypothetical protein
MIKIMLKFLKLIIINFLYYLIKSIERYEYRNLKLDENDISKKILTQINKLNISVKSDSGWVNATHIYLTQPFTTWRIELENELILDCADIHILFDENSQQIFCKDLKVGQSIQTKFGLVPVKKIVELGRKQSMFDLSIDHPEHRFFTNGILSHNTINAAITMLHFITFNNDKNIMIVANIRGTTIEIIDKIKNIYIQLPFFLKSGIKNWNQQSITFENGCRIKSSARSKTPAIGFTIDFLYLDEFAHIPSNIIEPYYTAAFPTVSAIENSKIIITSTPNGMNLFYKLLTNAERPDGDPLKNNYKPMRVYWYQVPGRFVTYFRLNNHRLYENGLTKEEVFNQVIEEFSEITKVEMKFIPDLTKDVIYIYNNENCSDIDVKKFIVRKEEKEISIHSIAEVTTWKEEAIKDIGGEDAFNQEYGLRFINATRSLLNENIIEHLLNNKKPFIYRDIEELDKKLKFSYGDLKWIDDEDVFLPEQRKSVKGVISIDISEGLGQDYSIINIFKIREKSDDVIESQKFKYTHLADFFCLDQIGIYRCNYASVKQLAEIFYLLAFEYFDYENFKVVLELNNYGNEFLAHLPHVFEGKNNYGSSIFFRYKHRADSPEEKVGLKVGENKNMLVKDYQEAMEKKNFIITNEDNIREITTFVKHITSAGNIRYAADIGHDDTVMSLVNAASVFSKFDFREMVDDYANSIVSKEKLTYWNQILKQVDYTEITDYQSILDVNRKRRMAEQLRNMNTKIVGNNYGRW